MASKIEMLVAARCVTYNQREYIKDTLNGLTMQKTTFPYICIIIDDASTDGEQEVIDAYLREHFDMENNEVSYVREDEDAIYKYAQHLQNKNCYFIVLELKKNLYHDVEKKRRLFAPWLESVKYNALCEGDDYWTDPLKLQKQVDFLEAHEECSMCYHNAWQDWDDKRLIFIDESICEHNVSLEEMLTVWRIPTASVVYRRDIENRVPHLSPHPNGDYCLELRLLSAGAIHYDPTVMSVYRMHDDSVSAGMNRNQVKMYQDIIDLLQDARVLYESDSDQVLFNQAIQKYEYLIWDYQISNHPIKKWLYRKTYTRAVKRWLGKDLDKH